MIPVRHNLTFIAMKNRGGFLAIFVVLVFGTGFLLWNLVWNLLGWSPSGPAPLLSPPVISRAAAAESVPVTNSFGTAPALPKELSDETFRKMISEFSEPGGYFMYENFLSNEKSYQDPIPALRKAAKPGGVYLGVGPEQNFTYIAAIRPQIAFIIDIRRQNMLELLMYKTLFGLAANRAEFVSLLFSRKPPIALDENSAAQELFSAYDAAQPDRSFFESNLRQIKDRLRLGPDDEKTIEYVYSVFFSVGPNLSYSSVSPGPSGPSYENLMTLTDRNGNNWSYLASEDKFRFIKEMQRKNLIVPLVGDFAGPKAIRTVGRYLKDQHATVTAFYLSNVEMYILASPQWKSFCANVASLPVDPSSVFIRFVLGGWSRSTFRGGLGSNPVSVLSPMIDVLTGIKVYPPSYSDLLHASH